MRGRMWVARLAGVVAIAALTGLGFSFGTLSFGGNSGSAVYADDSNGDIHSHCHTGSKGRGAGGNDKGGGDCGAPN
jgi:hypothetical protein